VATGRGGETLESSEQQTAIFLSNEFAGGKAQAVERGGGRGSGAVVDDNGFNAQASRGRRDAREGVPDEIAATVIVRPLLLKLAIRGTLAATVRSAVPLLSENVAWVMAVLSKVRDMLPGGTTGSRANIIRSFPGSVEMVGFTGAVKFSTKRGGVLESSWAVTWVATSPMNSRRAAS